MLVINDLWRDYSGLRVAHELGHVMGIDHHTPNTLMADGDTRNDFIAYPTCMRVRRYIEEQLSFLPTN